MAMSLFKRLKKNRDEEFFEPGFGGKPISKKTSKKPSTQELQQKVKRLKLEKQLKKLEPERKSAGQKAFESLTKRPSMRPPVSSTKRKRIA